MDVEVLWEVEQGVIDNMIIFQKPFPGAARTELEDPAGNCVPRPAEFARRRGRAIVEARHVWLMGRQWGVLFVR